METFKFCLALQLIKGQEVLIDISVLDIARLFNPRNLEEIDAFTLNFTKEEIINSIDRANIADGYLNGHLCVALVRGKKVIDIKEALTKDFVNNFNLAQYLTSIINNKNLLSNFANKYNSYNVGVEDKKLMINACKETNIDEIYRLFNNLNYFSKREFLIYLINNINKQKDKELKLDKSLE